MACRVFEEDEVSVIDGKILKCGLVLESTEFVSSDEDEDNPYISKLKKGAIRVAWHPDGTEEELDESKVTAHPVIDVRSRSTVKSSCSLWIYIDK